MALPNLTLRSLTPTVGTTKGSALTFAEMDTNLNNLANVAIGIENNVSSGDEGGEIRFVKAVTNTSLNTGITVDVYQDKLRIFETGGSARGWFSNIAEQTASAGSEIGFRNMPQVTSGNVTLGLTDNGKHYYRTSTAPHTITIPVNSSVAFPVGSVVSIVNQATGNITVDKGSATLYLAGNATSASRTVTTYGVATLIKVDTDTWFINGNGVV